MTRAKEKKGKRRVGGSLIRGFTPQMAVMALVGPGQCQEHGIPAGLPVGALLSPERGRIISGQAGLSVALYQGMPCPRRRLQQLHLGTDPSAQPTLEQAWCFGQQRSESFNF